MKDKLFSGSALVGRALIASLFFYAGYGKIMNASATKAYIASAGLPAPDLAYISAVLIETILPLLLILGWKVRPVAGVMAVFTLVTAVVFHADAAQAIQFYKNFAITGGLLQILALGGGAYSVDSWLKKSR
jgi:putative oxidoreductase